MSYPRYINDGLTYGNEHSNYPTSQTPDGELATNQGSFGAPNWQPAFQYEPILTSGSSAIYSSPTFESSWNPFVESFNNANSWKRWDKQRISNASSSRQNQYLPSSFGYAVELSLETNTSSTGFPDTLDTGGHPNSQGYTSTTAFDFVAAESPSSVRGQTSAMSHEGHSRKRSDRSSKQSNATASTTSGSSESKTPRQSTSKNRRGRMSEHNTTEKRYRGRINEEFKTLLSALQTASALEANGLAMSTTGMQLSKIEILDLAKKHIATLESEQAELVGEKQTLQVQLDFFRGIYENCGGQIIP